MGKDERKDAEVVEFSRIIKRKIRENTDIVCDSDLELEKVINALVAMFIQGDYLVEKMAVLINKEDSNELKEFWQTFEKRWKLAEVSFDDLWKEEE